LNLPAPKTVFGPRIDSPGFFSLGDRQLWGHSQKRRRRALWCLPGTDRGEGIPSPPKTEGLAEPGPLPCVLQNRTPSPDRKIPIHGGCSSWIEKNVAVLSVHEFLTGGFPASGFPRDVVWW